MGSRKPKQRISRLQASDIDPITDAGVLVRAALAEEGWH